MRAALSWAWRIGIALCSGPALPSPLTIYFETREPFTKMAGDSLSGLVGEPVSIALKRSGLNYEFSEMPFKRYMALIQRNMVTGCAAGAVKTPDREKAGKFSAMVAIDKPFVLIARKSDDLLSSMQTLREVLQDPKVRLLLHEGYSYGMFDALLEQSSVRAQVSRLPYDNAGMVRMLSQKWSTPS